EWIVGLVLSAHQRNAPHCVRPATALGVLISRALGCAHERDLLHRDIKPDHILLRRRGAGGDLVPEFEFEPVLIDFGVAARAGFTDRAGTLAYMSPEQARCDSAIDHRSDLYSLGATLFELLVGHPPHQGASAIATLARLATTPAARMSAFKPNLPPSLDDAIDALLQTDPQRRPDSAYAVEKSLLDSLAEATRVSWPAEEMSVRTSTSGSRLVTTLVALGFSDRAGQQAAVLALRAEGAMAVPLGKDAIVAHLGVERATGGEAQVALRMGHQLAAQGAAVGVASGRARLAPGTTGA